MDEPPLPILLVEPDRARAEALTAGLRAEGIIACRDASVEPVLAMLVPARWLARAVLRVDGAMPVVVADGPGDPAGRAALLDAGAADVLARPADIAELAARLRALLRIRRMPPIACADLSVDLVTRHATRAGRDLPLHPREFALLGHLARHRDLPVDRPALLRAVWRLRFDPGTNVVAVTISRVRAKVDHGFAQRLIHTVAGGYMLSAEMG